jgi:hypothetical protein
VLAVLVTLCLIAIYLVLSGAPWRVDAAESSSFVLGVSLGGAILWSRRLSRMDKIGLALLLLVMLASLRCGLLALTVSKVICDSSQLLGSVAVVGGSIAVVLALVELLFAFSQHYLLGKSR